MQLIKKDKIRIIALGLCILSFVILGLLASNFNQKQTEHTDQEKKADQAEVLPFLNIQEIRPKYALPFCEKKNCIEIDIQSINTQDAWMDQWILDSQSAVIQDQIGLKQVMTLQQAIDAYVKKSDAWQAQFSKYLAYELHMDTRIASQRNQYVLLQVIVNSKQEDVTVKNRGYFFVADRKAKKKLSILDVVEPKQQNAMNGIVQEKYAEWLGKQDAEVKKTAPKKLYWGQNDWFFDGEGVGIHYRASEIAKDGTQLDIYLSKAQTQQTLKADVFKQMF